MEGRSLNAGNFYYTLFEDAIRLMKKILPSLVFAFFALTYTNVMLASEVLKQNHPDRYLVVEGDTLWEISSMFLNDAWMWPEIWHVNPDIENPHLIYPGDEILLRYIDGEPQLSLKRREFVVPDLVERAENKLEKLNPQIRVSSLSSRIVAIPFDRISSMLPTGRIVEKETLEHSPYILASVAGRLLFGPGDGFYGRGEWKGNTSIYGVYREGEIYKDPETRKILGYEARELGYAKVTARDGDVLTFELISVKEDIRLGDRLMPTEQRRVESNFFPVPPDTQVEGVIINVVGGADQVGRTDVVVVNRGLRDGLEVGSIMAIHKHGARIKDRMGGGKVQLPSEQAGVMLIVRSYEKMSYGYVLETKKALNVGDLVKNP